MASTTAGVVVLSKKLKEWAEENGRVDEFETARQLRDDFAKSRGVTAEQLQRRAERYERLAREARDAAGTERRGGRSRAA